MPSSPGIADPESGVPLCYSSRAAEGQAAFRCSWSVSLRFLAPLEMSAMSPAGSDPRPGRFVPAMVICGGGADYPTPAQPAAKPTNATDDG